MKILIKSDVFSICDRIKEIDDGYFVMYNTNTRKFEIHNKKQGRNTYCLTLPYTTLDARCLTHINKTSIRNIEKIIKEIDAENEKIEKREDEKIRNRSEYKFKEIYEYANRSSNRIDPLKAYGNEWI